MDCFRKAFLPGNRRQTGAPRNPIVCWRSALSLQAASALRPSANISVLHYWFCVCSLPLSCVLTQCSVKTQAERQWQRANGGFPPGCMCPFSCEPIYLTIKLFRLNFMYRSKFLLLLQSTLKLEFTYMGCEGFYEMCAEWFGKIIALLVKACAAGPCSR